MPVRLHYMPGASSLAAHIALEWANVPCELVRMDRGALRTPEYLALQPAGTVPVLVDGDFVLAESVAILSYIADHHPRARLLGDGSIRARADTMRWLAYLNSDVNSAFRPIFSPEIYLSDAALASALAARAAERVRGCLRILEAQVQGRAWLTGERSVADAYLFVLLRWTLSTKIGLQDFPNLRALLRRMHADAGVHAALVQEEGLSRRGEEGLSSRAALERLRDRLDVSRIVSFPAEIVGIVEYREGEGITVEVRRGRVRVDATASDTVVSWADEKYRGEAAIPLENFTQYVADGAIRLFA